MGRAISGYWWSQGPLPWARAFGEGQMSERIMVTWCPAQAKPSHWDSLGGAPPDGGQRFGETRGT